MAIYCSTLDGLDISYYICQKSGPLYYYSKTLLPNKAFKKVEPKNYKKNSRCLYFILIVYARKYFLKMISYWTKGPDFWQCPCYLLGAMLRVRFISFRLIHPPYKETSCNKELVFFCFCGDLSINAYFHLWACTLQAETGNVL